MASGTDHLLEMSSSRRRFSAATGSDQRFDPTSHHPVAKDISSRIRSLLLSRNANRPPRAPNNSDEDLPRYYDVDSVQGFGDVFDFTTASRKTKREREGRMSLPALTHQSRSRSPSLISLDGVASPPPEPSGVANRGSLRTVSSESDMIDFAYNPKPDAERGYLSDGPTSPPPPPTTPPLPTSDSSKSKKPFRFPRLILKNKEKPNMLAVRSCMSTNGDDLACFIAGCKHPRLTPLEIGILREFRGHSRANSTDLANLRRSEEVRMKDGGEVDFSRRSDLEGLDEPRVLSPPSPSIYSQSTPRPLFSPSGAATAESSTEAINRPTRAITTVSPRTLSAVASKEEMSQDNKPLGIAVTNKDMQPQSAEGVPDIAPEKSAKAVQLILPQPSRKKSRLEINQGPLIPKNEEPVELVKRAQTIPRSPPEVSAPSKATVAPQPMSLPMPAKTIVQGISPMSTPTIEVDTPSSVAALSKQLDKTEKLNRKSPSLLSIASKKSSRHALLKPSGTTSPIAIDNGLPVPPILTPMDTIIGESFETHKPILDVMPEPATEEVVAVPEKRSSEKKKRFSISVVDQVGNLRKARDAVLEVEEKLRALQSDTSSVQEPQQPEVAIDCPCSVAKKPDVPQSPVHAQYWGFVPAVKDIVQNSVKDGVRAAVQEVRIPPNSEPSRASRAYRKLIGNSITEAAEEADLYLRRESIWDQPKPADVPLENDRENKTTSSQHRKPSVESVPLQTVEQALVDNIKEYRRLSKLAKNRSTIGYAAIPNRDSSRTRTKRAFSSDDAKPSESKTSALKSNDVNKTTAHWLKDMLSSNGPYESRLTARPPRTRKSDMGTTRAARSATAPAKPLENLHLVIEQDPTQESLMKKSDDPERVPVRETYTKTINDLELLFNEAMFIARQAADRSDPGYVPALLGSAAAVLQDGRKGYKGDIVKYQAEREYIDRRADNISTGSMHESLRSLSDSSDSYHSEEDEEEELQGVEEYRTQIIPPPSTAKSVRISSVPKEKPKSNQVASPRRPTPYPAPAQVADVNIVPPSSEGDDSFEDTSTVFADFDSEPVQSTVIKEKKVIQIIPEQADRVTQDMDPFLAAPKNGDDRRPSSCMSPNTARSRAATGPDDHNTSTQIVIDERAIPRALSGPVLEQLPVPVVVPTGANVSVIRLGNTSWVESNAQDVPSTERKPSRPDNLPSSQEVREYIREFHQPPIELLPRSSSLNLRKRAAIQRAAEREHHKSAGTTITTNTYAWQDMDPNLMSPCSQIRPELVQPAEEGLPQSVSHSKYAPSYDGVSASDALDFEIGYAQKPTSDDLAAGRRIQLTDNPNPGLPQQQRSSQSAKHPPAHLFSLTGKHHLSLRGAQHQGFSLTRSHKKPKIARDWSPGRKRFVASVACVSTALVGLLVGIYAAEVPAIQYYIVDFHHYVILGNVFFYIGLAIPTFFCWPLPLLHGRKPYVMGAMAIAMPLLFPQALSIQTFRSPYTSVYRVALLLPRALMGFVLGFANMNFKSTLTDLFGASLQSANPHQEVVDENDVRRHGGGLGAWLGIWTWCTIGSIGIGFMIGAVIINHAQPTWGFYVSIVIIAAVLFLNVICPEVRRSAFRRSVAEAKVDDGVSRRLGRGEVKMHMVQSGPKWWGQEMLYGIKLNMAMLRQPGFLVLAVYCGWIYGQVVLIIVLLGSLASKLYNLESPLIGASVTALPIGACLSIPFQKAGLFSRDRIHAEKSDDDTRNKKPGWSSHFLRRALFVLTLPFAGLGYTLSSSGPPTPFALPIFFAAMIGFLSNLALAECNGIMMETFDTSDLQPGMTGRPRRSSSDKHAGKRTNYSSFPRVMSAFGITQGFGYLVAALATGVGGVAQRGLGQKAATGVMAGILLILSVLLLLVLVRFREVDIIPDMHKDKMENYMEARRKSAWVRGSVDLNDEDLRPTIIGNPTHTTRRMCILEMGSMSRWSEIRKKNHLVNQGTYEAKHPNLAVLKDVEARIREEEKRLVRSAVGSVKSALSRSGSRRSRRSTSSGDANRGRGIEMNPMVFNNGEQPQVVFNEQLDLGGHRDMSAPGAGNGSRSRGTSRPSGVSRRSSPIKGRRKTTIQETKETQD